jgi:AraC-like DNA-binding protein
MLCINRLVAAPAYLHGLAGGMTIYIKNMVSSRCKLAVETELAKLGVGFTRVDLGQADIIGDISAARYNQIKSGLSIAGFDVIDDKNAGLIGKIKQVIIELVHFSDEPIPINLSVHLSQQLRQNYTYMANIFAEKEGRSIARFYIEQKIEMVKELLSNSELSLTEIAYKMHYSSVAHLSAQFTKVTGATASEYKQLRRNHGD